MKKGFLFTLSLLIATVANAQLSGTYTKSQPQFPEALFRDLRQVF